MKDFGSIRCCRGRPAGAASNRVIRGGSWNNNATNLTAANRNNNTPTNRNNNNGGRCVKTMTQPSRERQGLPEPCRLRRGSAADGAGAQPHGPPRPVAGAGFWPAAATCLGRAPGAPR